MTRNIDPQKGAVIIEGHVQGLSNVRALGEHGVPVIVVDNGKCVARYSKYCRNFFNCPSFASDKLADFLIELAEDQGLNGWLLLPSNDHAVLTISRNKERLEKYFKIFAPDLNILENINDKSNLLHVAEKVGVPFPRSYYAHAPDTTDIPLSFPVLTRGRFGLDFYKTLGCKAFIADDMEELRDQLLYIDRTFPIEKTLIQEIIPDDRTNKTVSFSAFCIDGEIKAYWMGEKVREHPVRFGTATFARSTFVEECHSHSVSLVKSLDYTGVCEIEYLKDPRDGRFNLIEINARTWLWVGLARACGVDFAKIVYQHVNGQLVEYPKSYKIGLKWINRITDTYIAWKSMEKGNLTFGDYLKSNKGEKVHAIFDKNDPLPALMFIAILPYLLKRRNR